MLGEGLDGQALQSYPLSDDHSRCGLPVVECCRVWGAEVRGDACSHVAGRAAHLLKDGPIAYRGCCVFRAHDDAAPPVDFLQRAVGGHHGMSATLMSASTRMYTALRVQRD
jgi:hypothetical protein